MSREGTEATANRRRRGMDGQKRCGRCGAVKPMDAFHADRANGGQSYCKTCRTTYQRERRERRSASAAEFMVEQKKCKVCCEVLPASCFYVHFGSKDCLRDTCAECESIEKRAKKYKLSVDDVLVFLRVPECQNPMCRMPFAPGRDGDMQMHFDHCHGRGHLRGVLCRQCNAAASGRVYECIDRLRGLIQYLKESEARSSEQRAACSPL